MKTALLALLFLAVAMVAVEASPKRGDRRRGGGGGGGGRGRGRDSVGDECESDDGCRRSVCDTDIGQCVKCLVDSDCRRGTCEDNECIRSGDGGGGRGGDRTCTSNDDCRGRRSICYDEDGDGEGQCFKSCDSDSNCRKRGHVCDTDTDADTGEFDGICVRDDDRR